MLDTEYHVAVAANGSQALRTAHEFHPDVVLTDLLMSDGDGWDLISELRKDPSFATTNIIAISGAESPPGDILDFGANDFIAKPFEPDELFARVAVAVRSQQRLARLHDMFDALPVGLFLAEPSGQLLIVNSPLAVILDYSSRAELCTQRIVDFVHEPSNQTAVTNAFRDLTPLQLSCSLITDLGTTVAAEVVINPVIDRFRIVTGFAGAVRPLL